MSGELAKNRTRGSGHASKKKKPDNNYNNDYGVKNTKTICVLIGTSPKENPLELLEGMKPRSRKF